MACWTGSSTEQPRLPTLSSNELRHYDAIIIGDLDGNTLSLNQQERIEQVVREEAVGLIWLPGESGNLASWRDTPLAQLIPVPIQPATVTHESYTDDIARRVQLRTPLSNARYSLTCGWNDWRVYAVPTQLVMTKVSCLQLCSGMMKRCVRSAGSRLFGTGSVAFMAVDDTWRWRPKRATPIYIVHGLSCSTSSAAAGAWSQSVAIVS